MFSSDALYNGLVVDMQRSAQRIMAKLEHGFYIEGEEYIDQLERHTCFDLSLFYKECLVNISRHSGRDAIQHVPKNQSARNRSEHQRQRPRTPGIGKKRNPCIAQT